MRNFLAFRRAVVVKASKKYERTGVHFSFIFAESLWKLTEVNRKTGDLPF